MRRNDPGMPWAYWTANRSPPACRAKPVPGRAPVAAASRRTSCHERRRVGRVQFLDERTACFLIRRRGASGDDRGHCERPSACSRSASVLPAVLFFGLQHRDALVEKQSEVEREGLELRAAWRPDINRRFPRDQACPARRTGDTRRRCVTATPPCGVPRSGQRGTEGERRLDRTAAPRRHACSPTRWCRSAPRSRRRATSRHCSGSAIAAALRKTLTRSKSRVSDRYVITVFDPVGGGDLVLRGTLPAEHLSEVLRTDVLGADWIAHSA